MKIIGNEEEQLRRRAFSEMFDLNLLQMISKFGVVPETEILPDALHGVNEEVKLGMQRLVGMENVKRQISSIFNVVKLNEIRRRHGLPVNTINTNMVFLGNPGTGKTTTARLTGQMLKQAGVLSKGHIVETSPDELFKSSSWGSERRELDRLMEEAKGGILFIDEVHQLLEQQGSRADYWRNVTTALMRNITAEKPPEFSVVLAGYEDGIEQIFKLEAGMKSRFPNVVHFKDYNSKELTAMFENQAQDFQYTLVEGCHEMLAKTMHEAPARLKDGFGNGRYVQNLFNETILCTANRMSSSGYISRKDATTITMFDIKNANENICQGKNKNAKRFE